MNTLIKNETTKLSTVICDLRETLSEIYNQEGPSSTTYIELSLQLETQLKNYYEVILLNLIDVSKEELIHICKQKGHSHQDAIIASQKLDETIIQYQKLKQLV